MDNWWGGLFWYLITALARNANYTLCTNWEIFLSEQWILVFLSYSFLSRSTVTKVDIFESVPVCFGKVTAPVLCDPIVDYVEQQILRNTVYRCGHSPFASLPPFLTTIAKHNACGDAFSHSSLNLRYGFDLNRCVYTEDNLCESAETGFNEGIAPFIFNTVVVWI